MLVDEADVEPMQLMKPESHQQKERLTGTSPTPHIPTNSSSSPNTAGLNEIASTSPDTPSPSTAGLSHTLPIQTPYYQAAVPIWLDETRDPSTWESDFLSEDAAEVIRAVGAWLIIFRRDAEGWAHAQTLMAAVKHVVENVYGGGVWDGALLCVCMPSHGSATIDAKRSDRILREAATENGSIDTVLINSFEEWDDTAFDLGFEFINGSVTLEQGKNRNEAGELRGQARLMEVLEANEWSNVDDLDEEILRLNVNDEGLEDETSGFRLERAKMEQEFLEVKMSMAGEDDNGPEESHSSGKGLESGAGEEQQVEELEKMMTKMYAARDMSSHLPEQEKKRFALRTVNDIMREM
ncbi:MAG: hypothetical protein Q9162_000847 [Coniocarpon cinnabarinum]